MHEDNTDLAGFQEPVRPEVTQEKSDEDLCAPAVVVSIEELATILEALLFVSGDAIMPEEIAEALTLSPIEIESALALLAERYDAQPGALALQRFGGKVQLSTKKRYHEYIERVFAPKRIQTLTASMLETLSIIAYKQPVTRLEVEDIRGVKCDYAVSALLHRGMIAPYGRKDVPGRPMLYVTTDDFLRAFALSSLAELPKRAELLQEKGADVQEEMTI